MEEQKALGELILSEYETHVIYDSDDEILLEQIKKLPENIYILDLHDVLDLFSSSTRFDVPIVCCSWMRNKKGSTSQTKANIKERIETGQIIFGIIVYKRGCRIKRSDKKELCLVDGSKAWFINLFVKTNKFKNITFFDNADDHIDSVKKLCGKSCKTIKVNSIGDLSHNLPIHHENI